MIAYGLKAEMRLGRVVDGKLWEVATLPDTEGYVHEVQRPITDAPEDAAWREAEMRCVGPWREVLDAEPGKGSVLQDGYYVLRQPFADVKQVGPTSLVVNAQHHPTLVPLTELPEIPRTKPGIRPPMRDPTAILRQHPDLAGIVIVRDEECPNIMYGKHTEMMEAMGCPRCGRSGRVESVEVVMRRTE